MRKSADQTRGKSPIGERTEKRWLCLSIGSGALIPPILMSIGWFLSGNIGSAAKIGVIFASISLLIVAIASARVAYFYGKLKSVTHTPVIVTHDGLGPAKKTGMPAYHFSKFDEANVRAYKKMYFWAMWGGFACTAFFSWFFINFLIGQILRSSFR